MKKYKYLTPFLKNIRFRLGIILLLSLGIAGIQLIIPYVAKEIFDKGVYQGNRNLLVYLVCILVVLHVVNTILKCVCNFTFTKTCNYFILDIQKMVYSRVMRMPLEFFDENKTGYIINRMNEVNNLSILFSPMVLSLIVGIVSFVGAIIMIARFNLFILVFVVLCMPILYILSKHSTGKIKHSSEEYSEASAKASGNLEENISGVREVKGLNVEGKRIREINKCMQVVTEKAIKRGNSTIMGSELIGLFANLSNAIFILIIGLLILKNKLSIGDYVALTAYVGQVFSPIQQFSMLSMSIQPGLVTLSRLGIFFENKTESEIDGDIQLDSIHEVKFEQVSFKYPKSEKELLNRLSFQARRGEKIVIVGQNGSGKSTIAKLILGFYKNYEGRIYFNDTEEKMLHINSLRKKIGIVSQNLFLFTGTIEENITMGVDNIEQEELKKVICDCGLGELVQQEYETGFRVNEGGKNLSGGQIQKIAVARALIRKSDIFIFDEVNNNLDEDTRQNIYSIISEALDDRIVFIITHDSKLHRVADKFIIFRENQVEVQDERKMSYVL